MNEPLPSYEKRFKEHDLSIIHSVGGAFCIVTIPFTFLPPAAAA